MRFIETQDFRDVIAQVRDKVTNTAHTKFAKVPKILSNLRGVEVELFSQRLRRNRVNARVRQRVQAAQIDA